MIIELDRFAAPEARDIRVPIISRSGYGSKLSDELERTKPYSDALQKLVTLTPLDKLERIIASLS